MKIIKKIILIVLVVIIVLIISGWLLIKKVPTVETKTFGVTFSKIMAEDFNLDWQKAYRSIVQDLGIKKVRIPVYWPEVEVAEGEFDFSWFDWILEESKKNEVDVILVVGIKVPRWPECHRPEWVDNESLLKYIETTVKRYNNHSAVWAWQVENEPFLKFGICPNYEPKFIDKEIELVRSISNKPIIVTDGGEFGDWFRAYKRADIFGSTMYRHVQARFIGEFTYPLPPSFFRLRQSVVELFYGKKPKIVVELQAEPWIDGVVKDSSLEVQYAGFGPERFDDLMEYIEGTGFDTFYFWGVEWWYWLKEKGHPEMWELVKDYVDNI